MQKVSGTQVFSLFCEILRQGTDHPSLESRNKLMHLRYGRHAKPWTGRLLTDMNVWLYNWCRNGVKKTGITVIDTGNFKCTYFFCLTFLSILSNTEFFLDLAYCKHIQYKISTSLGPSTRRRVLGRVQYYNIQPITWNKLAPL